MPLDIRQYDTAEILRDEDEVRLYLEEVVKDADAVEIAQAIAVAARGRGMTVLAKELGIPREVLFKAINGYPTLDSLAVDEVVRAVAARQAAA